MFGLKKKVVTAVGAAAFAAVSLGASAAFAVTTPCGTSGGLYLEEVTIDILNGVDVSPDIVADACAGLFSGNDKQASGSTTLGLIELNDNDAFAGYAADTWAYLTDATADVDATSGGWTVNFGTTAYKTIAVVLKGATGWGAWLFDFTPDAIYSGEGDFTMFINPTGGSGKLVDLSHMSIYTYDRGCDIRDPDCLPGGGGDIPLPAAAWLLIGGMGILGGMKRFARKS